MANLQSINLYPFASRLKSVDSQEFPEIVDFLRTDFKEISKILMDKYYNLYFVATEGPNNNIKLYVMIRQDFHRYYYSIEKVADLGRYPIDINGTRKVNPLLIMTPTLDKLYVSYNASSYDNVFSFAGDPTLIIKRYNIVRNIQKDFTGVHGIELAGTTDLTNFSTDVLYDDTRGNLLSGFNNFLYESNIYTYFYYVRKYPDGYRCEVVAYVGQASAPFDIPLSAKPSQVSVNFINSNGNLRMIYTYVTELGELRLGSIGGDQSNQVETLILTDITIAQVHLKVLDNDHISLIFEKQDTVENYINFLYTSTVNEGPDGSISSFNTVYFFKIDKTQQYNEEVDPLQTNKIISVVDNPVNSDISYILYVTSSGEPRLIKIYHEYNSSKEYLKYTPKILWSTRDGVFEEYLESYLDICGLSLDENGNIYVSVKDKIWKIDEFIIDMGHSVSTINQPPSTIPDLLKTLTTQYGMYTINNIPQEGVPILDVVISSIELSGNNVVINFENLDHDEIVTYRSQTETLKQTVQDGFISLYENSDLDVFDVGNPQIPGGDDTNLLYSLPSGSSVKPCVVKGTDVIVCNSEGKDASVKKIENIEEGDYVLNHMNMPVKVIKRQRTSIVSQDHNSPYVIPENFFGDNRPYKKLLISGDHGIFLGKKKVFPERIKGLRRLPLGIHVEYHHLLLEDDHKNYFLANGLEVESMHIGMNII